LPIHRPFAGGEVPLSDEQLAKLGLTVAYEATAKAVAASALRALLSLSEADWIKLERVQFGQIAARIQKRVDELADSELSERHEVLRSALSESHELRHQVVHAVWGGSPSDMEQRPESYDYGRRRLLGEEDIDAAVEGCAELKRAASWFAMRVANLIEDGVLTERNDGRGMAIRTENRLVRL
jgi:hypothetical protein